MIHESNGPFETIEGALEYTRLLYAAVLATTQEVETDVQDQTEYKPERRLEALRLVLWKLETLQKHLKVVQRTLNDLRMLKRLLLEDRVGVAEAPATTNL